MRAFPHKHIDRVCDVLFPWLPSVCTLAFCYIEHFSCKRALPHKYRVCAVLFSLNSVQFASFGIFSIVLIVRVLCFTNITIFCLTHAAMSYITCRMITLAYCGMLTFRLSVVTTGCTGCTRTFPQRVVHLRRFSIWERRRRRTIAHYDGNLDSQPLLVEIYNIFLALLIHWQS